ncbi:MAG: hypothetical protein WDK96_00275 [Candidatus Paceibacterota bacterium]|jgi:uncharacterized membrane protein
MKLTKEKKVGLVLLLVALLIIIFIYCYLCELITINRDVMLVICILGIFSAAIGGSFWERKKEYYLVSDINDNIFLRIKYHLKTKEDPNSKTKEMLCVVKIGEKDHDIFMWILPSDFFSEFGSSPVGRYRKVSNSLYRISD